MLEWNLPPIRFERAGTASFYLAWARTALFASTLVTNTDRSDIRERAKNIGIQIDFHFTFMSRFDMTLSTGYAKGYGQGTFTDDELMISLKIM
jgi:carbohydrate-selective porin OprB